MIDMIPDLAKIFCISFALMVVLMKLLGVKEMDREDWLVSIFAAVAVTPIAFMIITIPPKPEAVQGIVIDKQTDLANDDYFIILDGHRIMPTWDGRVYYSVEIGYHCTFTVDGGNYYMKVVDCEEWE